MQQRHLGTGNRNAGNVERLRKNQRHHFNAHVQRLGGKERSGAEFRVIADGQVFRGERSANKRQADVAQLHFASQRGGGFPFNDGPELVHGDHERRHKHHHNQHTHRDKNNLQCLIHDNLRSGRNERRLGWRDDVSTDRRGQGEPWSARLCLGLWGLQLERAANCRSRFMERLWSRTTAT